MTYFDGTRYALVKVVPFPSRMPNGKLLPTSCPAFIAVLLIFADAGQLNSRNASGPGSEGSMHWFVILWQVAQTPCVVAVYSMRSGTLNEGGTTMAMLSSVNATALRLEVFVRTLVPSG